MKINKLVFLTIVFILLASTFSYSAYAVDTAPSININSNPVLNATTTATMIVIATDVLTNAGLSKIDFYVNNNLTFTKNCGSSTTCTLAKTITKNSRVYEEYYAIATDIGMNTVVSSTVNVTYRGVDTPPILNDLPNLEVWEDSGLNGNLTDLWEYASDTWTETGNLTYSILSQTNTTLIYCLVDDNRYLNCTVVLANGTGISNVTVMVDDGRFNTNSTFNISVLNLNDAPELIAPIPVQTVNEDSYNETVIVSNYFMDIDSPVITYSVVSLNLTVLTAEIFSFNTSFILNLSAHENYYGMQSVLIIADDGENKTNTTVLVDILPVNDRPYFDPVLLNQNSIQDLGFFYDINATDVDTGDVLTYSDNSSQFVIDPSTGLISFTPLVSGTYDINISVCDDSLAANACYSESFEFYVQYIAKPYFENATPLNMTYFDPGYYELFIDLISASTLDTVFFEFGDVNFTPISLGAGRYKSNVFNLSAGVYNYRWHANYTNTLYNASPLYTFTILQATPVLDVIVVPGNNVDYGTLVNVSCGSDTNQVVLGLFRNLSSVSNPDSNVLSVGVYNYTCTNTGSQNYTANGYSEEIIIVNKVDPVLTLILDGLDSDLTVAINSTVAIFANYSSPGMVSTINLYQNGMLLNTGSNALLNSTFLSTPGVYIINVSYPSNLNYNYAEKIHYITVSPPFIKTNFNPISGSWLNQSSVGLTFDANKNLSCRWAGTDIAYSSMTNVFTGLGSYNATISSFNLGNNNVYVACENETAVTNTDSIYFVQNIIEQGSSLTGSHANNSRIYSTTVENSTLQDVYSTSSTIRRTSLTNCTVINSTVKDYIGSNCYITNSIVDPSDVTGSTINSSTIMNSNATNSYLDNSDLTNSNVDRSTLISAVLTNVTANNSIIIGSSLADSVLINANVVNNIITSGIIIYEGSQVYNATQNGSIALTNLINMPPVISLIPSATSGTPGTTVNFNASGTTDPNIAGPYTNTNLTYYWDFGDNSTGVGEAPSHTYSNEGAYTVLLTVEDSFGLNSTSGTIITISSTPTPTPTLPGGGGPSRGGRRGGGGGSYGFTRTFEFNLTKGRPEIKNFGRFDDMEIEFEGEKYKFKIGDITRSDVTITLDGKPYTFIEREIKKFDLSNSNYYDMRVVFTTNYINRAEFRFDLIHDLVPGFKSPPVAPEVILESVVEVVLPSSDVVSKKIDVEVEVKESVVSRAKNLVTGMISGTFFDEDSALISWGLLIGIILSGLILYHVLSIILDF